MECRYRPILVAFATSSRFRDVRDGTRDATCSVRTPVGWKDGVMDKELIAKFEEVKKAYREEEETSS